MAKKLTTKTLTDQVYNALFLARDMTQIADMARMGANSFAVIPDKGAPFTITVERD